MLVSRKNCGCFFRFHARTKDVIMKSLEGQDKLQDFNREKRERINIKAQKFSSQGLGQGQRHVVLSCFRYHLVNQLGRASFLRTG